MRFLGSVTLATLLITTTAQAQVYTWTDEQGHRHYGNEPPADSQARQVEIVVPETYTAREGVYSWTDKQGQIHLGNQPPADRQLKPVDVVPDAATAREGVYTWTDDQGQRHYSNRPPADRAVDQVDLGDQPVSTVISSELRPSEREALRELNEE